MDDLSSFLTVENFLQCKIDDEIKSLPQSCSAFCDFFSKKGKEYKDSENPACLIYAALEIVTSVYLDPDDLNKPYKPFLISGNQRSWVLEDLSPQAYIFLAQILDHIQNNVLKARVADALWVSSPKKNFLYAKKAVDYFLKYPLCQNSWGYENSNGWKRAVRLILALGKAMQTEKNTAREKLFSTFLSLGYTNTGYVFDLSELLFLIQLDDTQHPMMINKLETLKLQAYQNKDWFPLQDFCDDLLRWYGIKEQNEKIIELYAEKAQYFVEQAQETSNALVAATFYSSAIKEIRRIPVACREKYDSQQKFNDWQNKMNSLRASALASASHFSYEKAFPDLGNYLDACRKAVSNKDIWRAIYNFATITILPQEKKYREDAIKFLKDYPILAMAGIGYMNTFGGLEAKTPGTDLLKPESQESQTAIFHQMLKTYGVYMQLVAQTAIQTAQEVLYLEHRISYSLLLDLCKYSTIVPINRIHFFARGLYHGFNYNYSDAIHILTPQIENMVRNLLKNAGINTSKMSGDQDLLESEIGLSNLLRIPEISEIMDEDLIFNLKAIFAEKPGPNFRNEIAHGLLEETVANSHLAAYAWWFVFSLVVKFNPKVQEKVQACKD